MGGRGSRSNFGGGGNNTSNKPVEKSSITVNGTVVMKSVIESSKLLGGTNPLWGERGPDGNTTAYTHNCQRCTFAYEMRTRGYDVEATDKKRGADAVASGWMSAFEGMNYEKVGARRKTQITSKVEEKMSEYGAGSRAIVYVAWDGGSAHVFNVAWDGSKLTSVDAQTNRRDVLDDYASRCKPSKTMIARVDNLSPSELYLNGAIKPRKR